VYTGFERFKVGPQSDDFADSHVTLQPTSSSNKFLKPVAVLTDRNVYSASTTFLYSVRPIDQFTTIGQRSGGGSGSVADGYLANGWKWSLSTSEFIDDLGRHLDDGVDPAIPVALDTMVTTMDEVIERAIVELQ
jgi:C-terminal processing protease CtpA/Prc